ncbi:hypothetical protein M011DRAFT_59519 [Sporormia fimetaria CBS 119925]|uniref:Uncharacterized protein n=1 Tax=Sporormia fimetaria CBS 119925 TaxID=1340428 RepID=A0A6A6VE20_9PLEO|nr:hypothetical protein M011DRAFT_59519 [Sporormia fimetaria CBS 119925]
MNRFLTRKKDKSSDDGSAKKKKGKKGQPEPEPQINLATVLPPTDDFRTSLIMPSLSTRFSMLREQDDPNSKLGKASDDSVLHPKRQSRLHEFGFVPGGLSDIAEVSSIKGSARPGFSAERQDSFDSRRSEDNSGSVMTRSRPGEGNNLFGGRQKIYKISNTGSSKSLGGKILYEDDLHLSTFQKFRLEERERLRQQEEAGRDAQAAKLDHSEGPSSPTQDTYSPSIAGSTQRRETSSSTTSGNANARSSTAATSIASQGGASISTSSPAQVAHSSATSPHPPTAAGASAGPTSPHDLNRSATKGRRLYEQALDQHMHDQQSSAMNRLNSIQRTRAPTGRSTPPLLFSQPRSATNLHERFNRLPLNGRDYQSNNASPVLSRPQSPHLVSPLGSDSDEAHMLNLALQPNDRGKATAMGAFNKPTHAFSEQQYAERLKQLHQDRELPVAKPTLPKKPTLRERAEMEQRKRAGSATSDKAKPAVPPVEPMPKAEDPLLPSAPHEKQEKQVQKPSDAPADDATPNEKDEVPSAFSMFQLAANRMKTAASPPTDFEKPLKSTTSPPIRSEPPSKDAISPDSQAGATFFSSPGSSDDEDDVPKPLIVKPAELDRRFQNIPTATGPAPPILDHPALRSRSNSRGEAFTHPAFRSRSNSRPAPTLRERSGSRPAMPRAEASSPKEPASPQPADQGGDADVDSPTLGPTNGGLSGLIRQHLRNLSTVSSDYGENSQVAKSPPAAAGASQGQQPASDANTTHSSYTHSNPWDLDDIDSYVERDSTSSTSPVEAQKSKLRSQDPSAMLISPQAVNETISEWEKEMKRTHKREPSVEERDAFQRELALRQRAIQESLRTRAAENRGRTASPAPGGGLKNALNMLRAKSSRESFATVEQRHGEHKPMRMLGLGTNSTNASSVSLVGPYAEHGRPDERVAPRRILQQSEQDAQRELENRQRSATNDSSRDAAWKGRTPPQSSNSSTRGRSSSEVSSGRSRSRPRQYREEPDQSPNDGPGSRNTGYTSNNSTPVVPENPHQGPFHEKASMESQRKMRSRSNSRPAQSNYYEPKHLQPIQTSQGVANGSTPRLSPSPNSAMHPYSPGLPVSPRPSPGAPSPSMSSFRPPPSPVPPFSAHSTPPISGTSTPVAAAFNTGAATMMASNGALRKKSINKADISEPIFLSTTSVIDTVNLPSGASLKNGSQAPPPLPPINPMRRKFGFGRTPSDEHTAHPLSAGSSPSAPYGDAMYTNSTDALPPKGPPPRQRLRKTSSEGRSLHSKSQVHAGASPVVSTKPFGGRNGSPPRPINEHPVPQQNMNGAMF